MIEIKKQNTANSKHEILNTKQYRSTNDQNPKQYDLEERTLKFAKEETKDQEKSSESLIGEATELMKIFGSIAEKAK